MHTVGGTQFVHCREVVRSSECPLSEVPLYTYIYLGTTYTVDTYSMVCVTSMIFEQLEMRTILCIKFDSSSSDVPRYWFTESCN